MEHLGIIAKGGAPSLGMDPAAVPRGGWARADEAIQTLRQVPGPSNVRENLAMTCVVPKLRWAAPLLGLPPNAVATSIMRSILRHESSWVCSGRFWADRA